MQDVQSVYENHIYEALPIVCNAQEDKINCFSNQINAKTKINNSIVTANLSNEQSSQPLFRIRNNYNTLNIQKCYNNNTYINKNNNNNNNNNNNHKVIYF